MNSTAKKRSPRRPAPRDEPLSLILDLKASSWDIPGLDQKLEKYLPIYLCISEVSDEPLRSIEGEPPSSYPAQTAAMGTLNPTLQRLPSRDGTSDRCKQTPHGLPQITSRNKTEAEKERDTKMPFKAPLWPYRFSQLVFTPLCNLLGYAICGL